MTGNAVFFKMSQTERTLSSIGERCNPVRCKRSEQAAGRISPVFVSTDRDVKAKVLWEIIQGQYQEFKVNTRNANKPCRA